MYRLHCQKGKVNKISRWPKVCGHMTGNIYTLPLNSFTASALLRRILTKLLSLAAGIFFQSVTTVFDRAEVRALRRADKLFHTKKKKKNPFFMDLTLRMWSLSCWTRKGPFRKWDPDQIMKGLPKYTVLNLHRDVHLICSIFTSCFLVVFIRKRVTVGFFAQQKTLCLPVYWTHKHVSTKQLLFSNKAYLLGLGVRWVSIRVYAVCWKRQREKASFVCSQYGSNVACISDVALNRHCSF